MILKLAGLLKQLLVDKRKSGKSIFGDSLSGSIVNPTAGQGIVSFSDSAVVQFRPTRFESPRFAKRDITIQELTRLVESRMTFGSSRELQAIAMKDESGTLHSTLLPCTTESSDLAPNPAIGLSTFSAEPGRSCVATGHSIKTQDARSRLRSLVGTIVIK